MSYRWQSQLCVVRFKCTVCVGWGDVKHIVEDDGHIATQRHYQHTPTTLKMHAPALLATVVIVVCCRLGIAAR
jgi:hypothetical protein